MMMVLEYDAGYIHSIGKIPLSIRTITSQGATETKSHQKPDLYERVNFATQITQFIKLHPSVLTLKNEL